MQGKCKLCKKKKDLEVSHFIPKFIGKWSKKTSITGFLRESNEVHKRAQDLAKEFWLCGDCEDIFSKWETKFANKIFYPFVNNGISNANYGDWLSKFCASISWRTLTYIRSKNDIAGKPPEYIQLLDDAEIHISKFILGKVDNLFQYEQHLFPVDRIESVTGKGLPSNINGYFLRTISMDIAGNSSNIFTYTKLPSFIILGFIKSSNINKMRSSRIALRSGKISPRKYQWPDGFIDYIIEKANHVNELGKEINTEKIEKYIRDNPEKASNSKQFESFMHDYEMFGDKVFK